MKLIHLDPDFQPWRPGVGFDFLTFSGGEPHLRLNEPVAGDDMWVTTRVTSFEGIGKLLVAVDALRRAGAASCSLVIPYFPGARQDRVAQPGEALTVKVYADLINALNLKEVWIFDPHSDVTPALLDRVRVISREPFVAACLHQLAESYVLVAPDAGAVKKTTHLAEYLGVPYIECSKKRDTRTGALHAACVHAEDLKGQTCVVVDDICDGGATFLQLAVALKEKGAGKLVLIVSHGIFSKGLTELHRHYDRIFTTDSFRRVDGLIQLTFSAFQSIPV